MPPAPTGQLALGLLWIGHVGNIKLELNWPGATPPVEGVEVRAYPRGANLGWFGTGPDEVLDKPVISSDGRTCTYTREALPRKGPKAPPAPTGQLALGLLWIGHVGNIKLELNWPGATPPVEGVDVRIYPRKANLGWFGTGPDGVLDKPVISSDGRSWTYTRVAMPRKGPQAPPQHLASRIWGTEMVCVFVSEMGAVRL